MLATLDQPESAIAAAPGSAPNAGAPFASDRRTPAADNLSRLWRDRLGVYHTRLAAWLGQARDPTRRYLPATRRQAQLLRASGRTLAAQSWFARAARLASPPPDEERADLPPLILGAADEAELAALIERAA